MFREHPTNPLIVEISIWLQPASSRSRVVGPHGDPPKLKIQVAAPAVEGAANEELVRFLTKLLKAEVTIIRGEHSRTKTVRVSGRTIAEIKAKIGTTLDETEAN